MTHTSRKLILSHCAAAAVFASSLQFTGIAQAQKSANMEQVVITRSRIARDGYDAPTPVSVLSSEDTDAEASGSVADFAMTLPSIQGSTTATTNSGSLSNGQSGIAALNLRALVTGRTLVLFDGYGSYDIDLAVGQAELFISVKNLFDTDPEFVP